MFEEYRTKRPGGHPRSPTHIRPGDDTPGGKPAPKLQPASKSKTFSERAKRALESALGTHESYALFTPRLALDQEVERSSESPRAEQVKPRTAGHRLHDPDVSGFRPTGDEEAGIYRRQINLSRPHRCHPFVEKRDRATWGEARSPISFCCSVDYGSVTRFRYCRSDAKDFRHERIEKLRWFGDRGVSDFRQNGKLIRFPVFEV
jgi:hypothetical protein